MGHPPHARTVDVEALLRDEGLWEEWVSTLERSGEHTFEWYGPVVETTWEAGFSFPRLSCATSRNATAGT
jgi:hypothetical protein